jgi:hypothetical protein
MTTRDVHRRSVSTLPRCCLFVLASVSVPASRAQAQATAHAADPVGVWRGTSTCPVRTSPCHDEIAVYRITRARSGDSISVDGRKMVNGKEEEMGILPCRLSAAGTSFTCTMPNSVWRFAMRGDSLVGDLRLLDGTRYRDIRLARSH